MIAELFWYALQICFVSICAVLNMSPMSFDISVNSNRKKIPVRLQRSF